MTSQKKNSTLNRDAKKKLYARSYCAQSCFTEQKNDEQLKIIKKIKKIQFREKNKSY